TPGGVWSSGSTTAATVSVTGVVTGVASGSSTIIYTVGACSVSVLVNVGNALAAITGTTTVVCTGSTIAFSDATPGGVWSSSNTSIATVSGSVVVYGASAGTVNITYSNGGCSVSIAVTVNANSAGTITGMDTVCIGTTRALSDAVSGGVWSSTNSSRATVDPATGVVTGVTAGIDTIKYSVTNSCGTFTTKVVMHVLTAALCPTGVNTVTEGPLTELKIFPNPNGGSFTMNMLSAGTDEEVHVVITNIVGEKVREFITTTNKAVDIRLDPAAGIYLISASTAQGRYVAKVVVY
ncbi:MAG: T9SS type A sorting domain-containing protein, partial [Chitinophagales bacterium]